MANLHKNKISISGPREDVSVLYKSLEEYDAEVKSKEKETDDNPFNIGAWIKDKFSDKLPKFTEDDYVSLYRKFIKSYTYSEDADNKEGHIVLYIESPCSSMRLYVLSSLLDAEFPKYKLQYTEPIEFRLWWYEWWGYIYSNLRNDYADIIKDNNIVIPALIDDPEVSQIRELVGSLVEYDRELYVHPFSIGPEYDNKKVEILKNIESVGD